MYSSEFLRISCSEKIWPIVTPIRLLNGAWKSTSTIKKHAMYKRTRALEVLVFEKFRKIHQAEEYSLYDRTLCRKTTPASFIRTRLLGYAHVVRVLTSLCAVRYTVFQIYYRYSVQIYYRCFPFLYSVSNIL